MEKLYVKDREIVTPGDLLAEGMSFLPSGKAYRSDKKLFASTVGLVNVKGKVVKVIPLSGAYQPKVGDDVIGIITNVSLHGWAASIGGPFDAEVNIADATMQYIDLNKTSLNAIYNVGDYVLAKVKMITNSGYVKLSTRENKYHKLVKGNIISVSPTKIPRIIGKKGSMIAMVKDHTGCNIFVGQNGLVWIDGEIDQVGVATQIIKMIEKESHTSGLTDKVKNMLSKKKGGK